MGIPVPLCPVITPDSLNKVLANKVYQRYCMVMRIASSALPSEPVQYHWDNGLDTSPIGFHSVRETPGQADPGTKEFPGENPDDGSLYDVQYADDMLKHHDRGPVDVTDWSNFQVQYNTPHIPQEWRR